jgi:hypothetical protein
MVPAMILETGRSTESKTAASLLGQRRRCCDHESRPQSGIVLDDLTLTYFIGANKRFYLLRKMLVEMAGLLLLDTVGVRHEQIAGGIEQQITRDLAEAADLSGASAPQSCAHLHHHLQEAAECLAGARRDLAQRLLLGRRMTFARAALEAASKELRLAAGLLPGADMVDRGDSCCSLVIS